MLSIPKLTTSKNIDETRILWMPLLVRACFKCFLDRFALFKNLEIYFLLWIWQWATGNFYERICLQKFCRVTDLRRTLENETIIIKKCMRAMYLVTCSWHQKTKPRIHQFTNSKYWPFWSTLDSWIGEFVVSFFDVTNRLQGT